MASWFYAMLRVLHQKDVLKSTIHSIMFRDLAKNDKVRGAVMDIENEVFFKALYILLCAVFPAIYALPFADSNEPMMDKIYFFSQRTQMAFRKSVDFFNETEVFGVFVEGAVTLADEINEVWGE
jgi:mannose/fructose/N-acetylgalactosamine-specific phosphotransferase system component IID